MSPAFSDLQFLSPLLIALAAMFFQQTFASVGKVLPAVVAPLVIAELQADPACIGVDEAKRFMSKNGIPLTAFEQCQDGQKV